MKKKVWWKFQRFVVYEHSTLESLRAFCLMFFFFCVKNENFCSLFVFQTARFAFCFESFSGE